MASTNRTTAGRPQPEYAHVNGVELAYEVAGKGDIPLIAVHGAWGSRTNWDLIVLRLAEHFHVVTYDRRGHSNSERLPGQGTYREDVDDLAALIEHLGLAPAWVLGLSSGAFITLMLAATRPELVAGVIVHEPPLWSLLDEDSPEAAALDAMTPLIAEVLHRIATGEHAAAAELFVEQLVLGPGGWAHMPDDVRNSMIANAPTVPDELNDPEIYSISGDVFARYHGPVLTTSGDQSPPIYTPVQNRLANLLPQAEQLVLRGARHIPHITHPDEYAQAIITFASPADK